MQKSWFLCLLLLSTNCDWKKPARSDTAVVSNVKYNSRNKLTKVVLNNLHELDFSYNSSGSLVDLHFGQGSVSYGYENGGNRLWIKDQTGATEYYRDELGRVSDAVWRHGHWRLIHYDHDSRGRIAGISVYDLDSALRTGSGGAELKVLDRGLPDRSADWRERRQAVASLLTRLEKTQPEYRVLYQHDLLNRVTAMQTPWGYVNYDWHKESREVERRQPNGLTSTWKFDDMGHLVGLRHVSPDGHEIVEYRYVYTDSGRLLRSEETQGGTVTVLEYRRDAQGRTCEALPGADLSSPCKNDANLRPLEAGGASLGWDPNGSLSRRTDPRETATFDYDDAGRPSRARAQNLDVSFSFDGDGRLVSSGDRGKTRTYFPDPTYAGAEPWMEWDESGALAVTRYADSAPYCEVDASGQVRFLLRDGAHARSDAAAILRQEQSRPRPITCPPGRGIARRPDARLVSFWHRPVTEQHS